MARKTIASLEVKIAELEEELFIGKNLRSKDTFRIRALSQDKSLLETKVKAYEDTLESHTNNMHVLQHTLDKETDRLNNELRKANSRINILEELTSKLTDEKRSLESKIIDFKATLRVLIENKGDY